ncbi:MAG TPA: glycosidase [Spirochaetia bacterium]|nr:glycosidase [Spirochaetia bacterium]
MKKQLDPRMILKRHPENPVIRPDDIPGCMQIFNPSPVEYNGHKLLLVSMVFFGKSGDENRMGETRIARSTDGVHFTVESEQFIKLDPGIFPLNIVGRHIIDNRVTKIDDTWYILTPVGTNQFDGPCTILGKTIDFKTYEYIDIITLPRNRGASLFPEKIGGKYYKLDRPGAGTGNFGSIWISSSPDLIHWGSFRPVQTAFWPWGPTKIGPTPPIKTDRGWLVIIHGVRIPADGSHYYIGAMLLDLHEPWKVIGRTRSYLLAPDMQYEAIGTCCNVVFPCGALADFKTDTLWLYYGAADTRVCLATGSINEIIEACEKEW